MDQDKCGVRGERGTETTNVAEMKVGDFDFLIIGTV